MGRVDARHYHAGEESSEHQTHAHPLARTDVLPPPEGGAVCDGCGLPCTGVAYACATCEYVLHRACATAPRSMAHPGHPPHELVFNASPPRSGGVFSCDACGEEVTGFCFRCNLDFHVPCTVLPHQMNDPSHAHILTLHLFAPCSSGGFYCNICNLEGTPGCWLYHCTTCDFDVHLRCVDQSTPAPALPKRIVEEQPLTPARQYAALALEQFQFQQHMQQQQQMNAALAMEQFMYQQQMQKQMQQQQMQQYMQQQQMQQQQMNGGLTLDLRLQMQQQRNALNMSIISKIS